MKTKKYKNIYRNLKSILHTQPPLSFQASMSLSSSLLASEFQNWIFCGFYVVCKRKILEIGPYQGKIIPCTHINFGMGVCGTVAVNKETLIVKDVLKYPNYISCDSKTSSEIVVPIFQNEKLVAVLDIDSKKIDDFNEIDKLYLENISKLFFSSN